MKKNILFVLIAMPFILAGALRHNNQRLEAFEKPANAAVEIPAVKTGTITGRVIFQGQAPNPKKLMIVKDAAVCGNREHFDDRLSVSKTKGIRYAVISVLGVQGVQPLSALGTEFVLDQQGCAYQPHVLIAPVNTPIKILNNDSLLHNIHTFSKINRPMNLAQPKDKKEMEIAFKKPERIPVKCDIHGWMSAWIVTVDHPFHAVSDADGKFTISGLLPGTYTVSCWQELLGEQTAQATVSPNGTVLLDFKYTRKTS